MQSIIGTWRLVKAEAHDAGGKPLPAPYGGKGMGRVTFNADGRMAAVVVDGQPELPSGAARDYSSYCGNYAFDGKRLVTRVDAASDPARLGSDQVREVSHDGDLMVLRPPPRPSGEFRVLTWEKISEL
ncbi:MAG TPA: lipocalin-like domain-containing protein [Stellaceae bacterium]|nr:lipocalin-like domain-containing protein [Stellaceae bacterium]